MNAAAVIAMGMALCVFSAVSQLISWISLRRTALLFWSFSWLALGARLAFDFLRIRLGDQPILSWGTMTSTALFAVIPLFGFLETARLRSRASRWLWAAPGWAAAWSAVAQWAQLPELSADLPALAPAALSYPAGAAILLAARPFGRSRLRWLLAAAWLALALFLPAAPWMQSDHPLAPEGFAALAFLSLTIATGLLFLTFREILGAAQEKESRAAAAARTLGAVIDESPHPLMLLDTEGRVQVWSRAAERVFGWTAAEAAGRTPPAITGDDEIEFRDHLRTTLAGERVHHVEIRRHRRDGTPVYVNLSTTPLRDETGTVAGALWVLEDLTTRRMYRETISHQLQILDSAMDAILVRDTEERLVYCNKAALKLYEYGREQLAALDAKKLVAEEDFSKYEEARGILATTGEWEGELRQRSRSGRVISVHSRWSLVHDDAGLPRARLIINTDISRQKELESQLRRTQRMESLGTLASGIAHDLNNILSPILMSVDMLKQRYTEASDKELLGILATSVRRGSEIVRQMLTFARGTEGEMAPLQLRHVVREVETILRETFPRSIAIATDVPKDLPLVVGDPTQIHQLLLNLCVNSRDAMPEGGNIEIRARAGTFAESEARAAGRPPGPCVRIFVIDDGSGIPPEIQDRIFEPFFTTKEKGKGTGLGLSTVLSIVRNHGGLVRCESEVGKGATFEVCLPAAAMEAPKPPEEAAPAIPLGAGETVLVVDDDASIVEITQQILESYGYIVFGASSGPAALEIMKSRDPDSIGLVLTDMDMPSMGGAAAVRAMRTVEADIPIIIMSGLPPARDSAEVRDLGVSGVIGKPFRAAELLILVREVLDAQPAGLRRAGPGR